MPDVHFTYDAPKTVREFMASDAFVRLIAGPIGSGKSSGSVAELVSRSCQQGPGKDGIRRTRWAVIRNTYPELRDTTEKTFSQWVDERLGAWNKEAYSFTMRFGDVESEILFRALDRPADVKKLLSLELTGAYINEAREIPKQIFDGLTGRVGRYPATADGGATWSGIWMDSNLWHDGHWFDQVFGKGLEGFELYVQPSGDGPDAENLENLPRDYYKRASIGKDAEWIDVYVRALKARSDVGSIYGKVLADLKKRGGLDAFELGQHPEVFTFWDLGHNDATAIWFVEFDKGRNVDFIDFYQNHGQPMSFYFRQLKKRADMYGYRYAKHFLPHDARQKNLQTGSSILEMCISEWGQNMVSLTPNIGIANGLEAGRWLLEQSTRIHPRCSEVSEDGDKDGVDCLRQYKRKWDEERKVFSSDPVHDWASNAADAYRYAAVVARRLEELTRPSRAENEPVAVSMDGAWSLDELWKANERPLGEERV